MYEPSERAGIFGWYLLGPLLGPTLGPLLGGIIIQHLEWPWLFWMLAISCGLINITSFLFLKETYVPVLLAKRKKELEKTEGGNYYYEGEDGRPLSTKMIEAWKRPLKILFTQPIVITMASYQALIFATTYSLYTQFQLYISVLVLGSLLQFGSSSLRLTQSTSILRKSTVAKLSPNIDFRSQTSGQS
jgi:MFS family permease